ncbi:BTAD domain-containing putative transcriptional regulator [Streptomyces sp. NPDC101152]|uniref:AfsR/SARP family transcriptional regulator n=1 Tax=Streptomyces sp. NPDC101152 TaxID=3366116 RepID=UPI003810BC53
MDIEVLGQFAVSENGQSIVPTAGKPRQILALLALRAGRVVPVATLMEELWGDDIPRSAATTLQTYILQLRKHMARAQAPHSGRSPKDLLATTLGGYRITARPEYCDWTEFQSLAARGSTALAAGDVRPASVYLTRALALWRGPALVDVPVGRVLGVDVIGMEETRMQVQEDRMEVELRLGRHSALLGELRTLVAQHPLNENLCAQLMTALCRSGSPWRALQEFRRLRERLHRELGVEPSPRLQRLHQAVLSGAPELDGGEPFVPLVPGPSH